MFKGREYLSVLGVYDYRKRIYHPGLGLFFQTDPIGFSGSETTNLYRYCNHNPLTASDPMGEDEGDPLANNFSVPNYNYGPSANLWIDAPSNFFPNQGAFDTPFPTFYGSGTTTAGISNFGENPAPFSTIGGGLSLFQSGSANVGNIVIDPSFFIDQSQASTPTSQSTDTASPNLLQKVSQGIFEVAASILPIGSNNRDFLASWLAGTLPRQVTYSPDSQQTHDMQQSPGAAIMRNDFYMTGAQGSTSMYGTPDAYVGTMLNPLYWSSTAMQVGGFSGATVINNGDGTATFTITNDAGTYSFFYHRVPNSPFATGPMHTVTQTFIWVEPINPTDK
jgi:RHS repeat-associated protein